MGLERVVRIYQLPENAPNRQDVKAGQIDPEDVRLEAGKGGGSGKTLQGSVSVSMTFYCDSNYVEYGFIPI